MDGDKLQAKVLGLYSQLCDEAGVTEDRQRGVEVTTPEIKHRLEAIPGHEYLEDLMALKDVLSRRDPSSMGELIRRCHDAVQCGRPLPDELLVFVFERLMEASQVASTERGDKNARHLKIAQALRLSGRPWNQDRHYETTWELLKLEFQHGTLGIAISVLMEREPGRFKNERNLRDIYRKNRERVLHGCRGVEGLFSEQS